MKKLSDRLRHARVQRGLTQAELARACRLSQSAISNYETGQRVAPKDLLRLAEVLQVSPLWLQRGTGDMDPVEFPATSNYHMKETLPSDTPNSWPFGSIDPADFWNLRDEHREIVEKTMAVLVRSLKSN